MLIGTTREGTGLLQHDPEEPLPLAEMIRITNSRLVRICWSLNPPSEPIAMLFYCHPRNNTEESTPPRGEIRFAPRDNRGPPPDALDDGSAGSDDGQSSDGHQPESSAAAGKRTTTTRTTTSGNTTKKTGRTHRINWAADVGESEPESSGMQASVPRANLGTRVLRSSRQGERETNLKKASRTPAKNSGKRNLVVMQEAYKPYGSYGSPGPQRKVARQVGAIDAGIEVEPDTRDGEHNLSWQLADRTSPTDSSSPFTPNPGHPPVSAASEQAEVSRSAAHLLMLASGAEQPVNTLATQVDTPGRSHSPSEDPHTGDVCADIPTAEEVGRELSPPADSPTASSAYSTPGKFWLRLLGFLSIL